MLKELSTKLQIIFEKKLLVLKMFNFDEVLQVLLNEKIIDFKDSCLLILDNEELIYYYSFILPFI